MKQQRETGEAGRNRKLREELQKLAVTQACEAFEAALEGTELASRVGFVLVACQAGVDVSKMGLSIASNMPGDSWRSLVDMAKAREGELHAAEIVVPSQQSKN